MFIRAMYYLSAILLAAAAFVSGALFAIHLGFRPPRRTEHKSPADLGVAYDEVRIGTRGGKRLYAWWLPAAENAAVVILLHGWGGNAELMLPLALPLRRAGLNVLLLDARNHGRSDSAWVSSLPRFAEDAGAAVDWAKGRHPDARPKVVLMGHSVGAGAVLLEASQRDDISAAISIAAFAHPRWMMRRYLDCVGVPRVLQAWILGYAQWIIGYRYTEIAPMNTACRVRCPVLLVHGTADETVPFTDVQVIRQRCRDRIPELLLIEGGTHDSVENVERHADQLLGFLKRAGVICEIGE